MNMIIALWLLVGAVGFMGMAVVTAVRKQYSYSIAFAIGITYVAFCIMKVLGIL